MLLVSELRKFTPKTLAFDDLLIFCIKSTTTINLIVFDPNVVGSSFLMIRLMRSQGVKVSRVAILLEPWMEPTGLRQFCRILELSQNFDCPIRYTCIHYLILLSHIY